MCSAASLSTHTTPKGRALQAEKHARLIWFQIGESTRVYRTGYPFSYGTAQNIGIPVRLIRLATVRPSGSAPIFGESDKVFFSA